MRDKGFTLIEVMVALVIISLALPALMMRMSTMSDSAIHSREVTMAYWVAENKMQEVFLDARLRNTPPKRKDIGDVELGGLKWEWQVEMQQIPGPEWQGFYRLFVRVSKQDSDNELVEISGFFLE